MSITTNPEAVARAVDSGVVLAADVEKIFVAPKVSEAATASDHLRVAFALGRLSESSLHLVRSLREYNAVRGPQISTPEDLERFFGRAGDVSSVADLEKLFKLS